MSFDTRFTLDTSKGVTINGVSQNGLVAVLMAQGAQHSSAMNPTNVGRTTNTGRGI